MPVDASDEEWRTWADTLPLAAGFDVRCICLAPGSGEFVVESSPISVNPNGAVHGGVVAAVIDHALGVVCVRMVHAGDGVATASLNIDYYRPCVLPMRLSVSVQRSGRTVVFARVQVTGADGELYAEASGVMSVRPSREARRALERSRLP
ncbi:PaaI family thioesterase [Streptomyces sp. NBC_01320]|uniref:PaaI family thioesterase n=1 Tax=Streptomyces sp. NBC_01320 TaxID=2903824 RepID=UPI002E0D8936|nr:PaaI family thioesterase [Streptomyces sp. NBC_01320]